MVYIALMAAAQGGFNRLKTRNGHKAAVLLNKAENEPSIPTVEIILSFAINPEKTATAACQLPNPIGLNK